MMVEQLDRRTFLAGLAATGVTMRSAIGQGTGAVAPAPTIGIQIGAVSFLDEGTERVLDILQERAHVNTLFMATFTYGRGIAGRQIRGFPFPDHGKQEYDADFHGGNFATPHAAITRIPSCKRRRRPTMAALTSWQR